jgi:hypothetical protein
VPGHGPARFWLNVTRKTNPAFGLLFHFDALRRRPAESGADGRNLDSALLSIGAVLPSSSAHRAASGKRTRSLTPSRAGFRVQAT